jgi:hypothetical protein
VDGVIPPETCAALRAEIDGLRRGDGLVRPNCTHLVDGGGGPPRLLPKAHIYEAEITIDPKARAAAPLLAQVSLRGWVGLARSLCNRRPPLFTTAAPTQ